MRLRDRKFGGHEAALVARKFKTDARVCPHPRSPQFLFWIDAASAAWRLHMSSDDVGSEVFVEHPEMARRLGISPRLLTDWNRAGMPGSVKIGGRRLYDPNPEPIRAWVRSRSQDNGKGGQHGVIGA